MTYGPCSSTVIQEGAPHSEKMRTVIGTGVQRLPLLPADLRHQPFEYVELKQEFKRVRLWLGHIACLTTYSSSRLNRVAGRTKRLAASYHGR